MFGFFSVYDSSILLLLLLLLLLWDCSFFLINILDQDKLQMVFNDFSPGLYFNIFSAHLGISMW